MHSRRKTILVTGFGPFPGIPSNASAELVPRLVETAARRLAGFTIQGAILPTEWRNGPLSLDRLLRQNTPALVLLFGVSPRTNGFAVEMRGRNACSRTPDAVGESPASACIAEDGPEFLASTLPVHHIVARLRQRGLPARISHDAGGYLCNALLYHSLAHGQRHPATYRAGFVHIPDSLTTGGTTASRRGHAVSRMNLDQAVEGGLEIIAASLGRAPAPQR